MGIGHTSQSTRAKTPSYNLDVCCFNGTRGREPPVFPASKRKDKSSIVNTRPSYKPRIILNGGGIGSLVPSARKRGVRRIHICKSHRPSIWLTAAFRSRGAACTKPLRIHFPRSIPELLADSRYGLMASIFCVIQYKSIA